MVFKEHPGLESRLTTYELCDLEKDHTCPNEPRVFFRNSQSMPT